MYRPEKIHKYPPFEEKKIVLYGKNKSAPRKTYKPQIETNPNKLNHVNIVMQDEERNSDYEPPRITPILKNYKIDRTVKSLKTHNRWVKIDKFMCCDEIINKDNFHLTHRQRLWKFATKTLDEGEKFNKTSYSAFYSH